MCVPDRPRRQPSLDHSLIGGLDTTGFVVGTSSEKQPHRYFSGFSQRDDESIRQSRGRCVAAQSRSPCANPNEFFHLAPGQKQKAGTLLTLLSTNGGQTDISEIIRNFSGLVAALDRPIAFYIRLLNPDIVDFADVEKFFRQVVDPAVKKRAIDELRWARTHRATDL